METQIQGENVAPVEQRDYTEDASAIVARLEAEAKAQRAAASTPKVPAVPAMNTATEAPPQREGNPSGAKVPEANKPDSLQQFRDKDGNVDPQRIEKANEHLQESIEDRDTRIQRLLKSNKELMRKFNEKSHEAKAVEGEASRAQQPVLDKQARLAHLDRDPVEAVEAIAEIKAREIESRLLERLTAKERADQELTVAENLDRLGQNGHSWIYTQEGSAWFNERFQEEPALLKMRNPYAAAVKMFPELVPSRAQQSDAAPSVRSTPTLGGGRAVPPPSSSPTETPGQQLKSLKAEFALAVQMRDMAKASEVGSRIKEIENKGLYRVF